MIADEAPAGIGHNSRGLVDAALRELREAITPYTERRDQLIASAGRAVIRNRADAGDAADVIRIANQVRGHIEDVRRSISDPHREAAEAVKAEADGFWLPAIEAMEELARKIQDWHAEEAKRITAQKAEQEAAMAAMRGTAPTPDPAPDTNEQQQPRPAAPARIQMVRGDLGGKIRSVDQVEIIVEDVSQVPDFILNAQPVHDAIISVVRSMARKGTQIPGLRITQHTVARAG